MRLVPPVVVLGALAVVAFAVATRRDREPREAAIRARWDSAGESSEIAKEAEAYLRDFGDDPEARWFAAQTFARTRRLWQAYDAVFTGVPGSAAPADRRRFARLLIDHLGLFPGGQTLLYPRCVLARVEGDDPAALADLRAVVSQMPLDQMVHWYVPAHRAQTAATRAVGRALNDRPDGMAKVAGTALLAAPGSGVSIDPLLEVLSTAFRVERTPTWMQVCKALGLCGEARAVEALRRERERLGDRAFDGTVMIAEHRFALDVGLALAGDEAARRTVETAAGEPALGRVTLVYAEGLQVRVSAGEKDAAARLVALYDAVADGQVRMQIFYGFALSDVPPPADVPMGRLAADFLATRIPFHVAFADVWAFRQGTPGAAAATERDLRAALEQPEAVELAADGEGEASASMYEILRAWLRWSR